MADSLACPAAFARGFFAFLESREVPAVVLHGGEDGFERVLSDIDFAVGHQTFAQLPSLVREYCGKVGWRLCQVLRHETTAAYLVCSSVDEPSHAVALDACSDYQRNGTRFLAAEELLDNTIPLPWGGHGLSPACELRYRFVKAAAKNKTTDDFLMDYLRHPEVIRNDFADWLRQRWGINPPDWQTAGIGVALAAMASRCRSRPSLWQSGALRRITGRILRPTGLVVVVGAAGFDDAAARLEAIYGHLYFRRFRKVRSLHPGLLKDLIASTLIVIPELGIPWRILIPKDCLCDLTGGFDSASRTDQIARFLDERCERREMPVAEPRG